MDNLGSEGGELGAEDGVVVFFEVVELRDREPRAAEKAVDAENARDVGRVGRKGARSEELEGDGAEPVGAAAADLTVWSDVRTRTSWPRARRPSMTRRQRSS